MPRLRCCQAALLLSRQQTVAIETYFGNAARLWPPGIRGENFRYVRRIFFGAEAWA